MKTSPVALYYPHTRIHSQGLLKTALLLWDQVECIIPNGHMRPTFTEIREVREAEELLVRRRIPTLEEKQRVHERVQQVFKDGAPAWIHNELRDTDQRFYLIYPEKLSRQTWSLLEELDLAQMVNCGDRDYQVPPALGLMLMSILADECASKTRIKVTDRTQAYSWLMGLMTSELGGEYLTNVNTSQLASTYDRLVTMALRTVNAEDIPLQRLVELRRREAAGSSSDLRKLRQTYADATTVYIGRLADPKISVADRAEIQRQYRLEMERDFKELKRELGLATTKALLSKEVGAAVLAGVGAMLEPSAIAAFNTIGIGALVKTGVEFREARRKALQSHAMSWLYVAGN